nr:hypothetical protein [Actinomycetes bacterium]
MACRAILGEQQHRVPLGQGGEVGDHERHGGPSLQRDEVPRPQPGSLRRDQVEEPAVGHHDVPVDERRVLGRAADQPVGGRPHHRRGAHRTPSGKASTSPATRTPTRAPGSGTSPADTRAVTSTRSPWPTSRARTVASWPKNDTSSTSAGRQCGSSRAVTATCSGRTASSTRPSRVPRTRTRPSAPVAVPATASAGTSTAWPTKEATAGPAGSR